MECKLSIIVPVYNVEKYVEKCLKTLVAQEIDNYEVIVVVDGSTDNSISIVRNFADKYPNIIKYFEIENQGLSAARNFGLSKACGEYVGFVDSDDYIDIDMYKKMYEHAKQQKCDVVVCDYFKVTQNGKERVKLQIKDNDSIDSIIIKARPYAWNKLFKRSLFNRYNIKFPQGLIFEDICSIYPLMMVASNIQYVDNCCYNYVYTRSDSIMNNRQRDDNKIFEVLGIFNKYCIENNLIEQYEGLVCEINVRHIFYRLREMHNYNTLMYNMKFICESFKYLNTNFHNWKKNSNYVQRMKKIKKYAVGWKVIILLRRIKKWRRK